MQEIAKTQVGVLPTVTSIVQTNPLLLSPEHWGRLKELARTAAESGLLPKHIDTPQKAFIITLKGHELGFSPMYALERLSVINGKATIDGQAMLRLIFERAPHAKCDLVTAEGHDHEYAEWEMARPGGKPRKFKFTIGDAKLAGLLDKPGPWKQYPKAMLRWRALSEGARFMFPDVIAGLYLHEEMGADVNEMGTIDVTPPEPKAPLITLSKPLGETKAETLPPPPTPSVAETLGFQSTESHVEAMRLLKRTTEFANWTPLDGANYLREHYGGRQANELHWAEFHEVLKYIEANAKPKTAEDLAAEAIDRK